MSKTSAYVFPFRPFRNLERTTVSATMAPPRSVTLDELTPILDRLVPPIAVPAGGDWSARLMALLTDPQVGFGDPAWVLDLAASWIDKARPFVAAGQPIAFTILGFPFKAPVPLKTRRILPDFGELVMLKRLQELALAIGRIHAPGARIHVFAEGAFARLYGLPQADSDAYFAALEALNAKAGHGETVVLHETARIADETPGFLEAWEEAARDIRARRDAGDPTTTTALVEARPVTLHLTAAPAASEDQLRRAYLGDASAAELRADLERRTDDAVVRYRAFLEARDRLALLERFAPGALGLTVSPRPGRIGVRPLPPPADVLPYHGVPVWHRDRGELTIEYRWDILTSDAAFEPLHLAGDSDPEPFLILA